MLDSIGEIILSCGMSVKESLFTSSSIYPAFTSFQYKSMNC